MAARLAARKEITMKVINAFEPFDRFESGVKQNGIASALGTLVSDLSRERAALPDALWKAWCRNAASHSALDLLLQDPYSRDARTRPAGYAGDARTLDYVYLRDPHTTALTPEAQQLFETTTSVAIAGAVRDRCHRLAGHIEDSLRGRESISVASLACGHARELDQLSVESLSRVCYWGLDQDPKSIDACKARFNEPHLRFELGSALGILQGRPRIPNCDLVYASGLFDYLDQRIGVMLLKRMFSAVTPGGRLVVANLTPSNDEIGYMEAVMDWWMYYRDEAGMASLAETARLSSAKTRVSIYTTSHGRMAWLQVERLQ
jgi:extracellular factor (EF) 3-hydroxypalmitic acid methyl ester biosynthesis protein